MTMHYSKTTNSFYPAAMRADYEVAGSWPSDAVEVSDQDFREFSHTPSDGSTRGWSEELGRLVWVARAPDHVPDLALAARARRDALLSATDWVVTAAWERGVKVPAKMLAYRAALRDLSSQPGFPTNINWPVAP